MMLGYNSVKMRGVIKNLCGRLKPKKGLFFAIVLLAFGFATLFATTTLKPAVAATKTPCSAPGFSLNYKSDYTGACLGSETNLSFVEFVVKFNQPVANADITLSNGTDQYVGSFSTSFEKKSDTLYVSKKDSRGLGYQVAGTSITCSVNDKYNQITITVKANGQEQKISVNACTEVKASRWTIENTSTLSGDNGQGSGLGRIVGRFTTIRGKDDNQVPASDPRKIGTAEKEGVIKITLTGPTSKTGDNTSDWYTLADGNLTIPGLTPGTYSLTINYNDRATAVRDNIIAEWANANITVTQDNIVVEADKDTTINLTGGAAAAAATTTEEKSTCTAGEGLTSALSWLLCPLTEMIINSTEFIQNNLIIPYLTISPLSQDANNAVYKLWDSVRNVANILFIVAFFIIIFSQATSIGISNYGIKKLLPRLVLVAIGTNLSYYFVAFAIDAFNILGAGVADLVMAVLQSGGGGEAAKDTGSFWNVVAVGLGAALFASTSALGLVMSLLGSVFLIILAAVIVLILRQMVILALVIVAPLAFVAWLLPNTEQYFTKWRQLLIKLLMMYPLIVLLFAVGKIISSLLNSGDLQLSTGASGSGTVANVVKMGVTTFAAALPLLLIPATFMASGAMMGKFMNAMQRGGQQIKQAGSAAYKGSRFGKFREARANEREREVAAGNYSGPRWRVGAYARSARNRALNTNKAFNAITGGYGSNRALDVDRQKREEQETFKKQLGGDFDLAEAWVSSGGRVGSDQYNKLNAGQQQTFRQMHMDNRHKSADSFIASQQLIAESGRGNGQMLSEVYSQIRQLSPGTADKDIHTLAEASRSSWRKAGRGDLVSQVDAGLSKELQRRDSAFGGFVAETTQDGKNYVTNPDGSLRPTKYGWSEMAPQTYSRHSFDPSPAASGEARTVRAGEVGTNITDENGNVLRTVISNGEETFRGYISQNRENLRTAVSGIDDIQEPRAKAGVIRAIQNELAGTDRPIPAGSPANTPPVKYTRDNILQELRDEFRLNRGT